jgi:nucleotide-binding universal stress UspA family protein
MTANGRIVVGVDASPASREALGWAVDEAAHRGWRVEAVHVWSYPPLSYAPGIIAAPVFAHDDLEAAAVAELDEAVDEVLAATDGSVKVGRVVAEGGAAQNLIERAHGADLLVVGHRGRGGFRDLLLGSVAHQCAAHAPCPVVVVRPQAPA